MYVTNLDKKIDAPVDVKRVPTICAWSDLLGFSKPYTESDWKPDGEAAMKIARRLRDVQILCMRQMAPDLETVLVSNDAFIRNVDFERIGHIEHLSMWFRALIWFHMGVNSYERDTGNPGMRTVVAGGERLLHNFETVCFEDYVYNYTKPEPEGKSTFPVAVRDEVLFYNPSAFQMNTGFSKSYILDSAGSRAGLCGNAIYIDQSVFSVIREALGRWKPDTSVLTEVEKEDSVVIYVKNPENGWYHIGFELSRPMEVEIPRLKTKVYRLLSFYPWDEDPKNFRIDVDADMPYHLGPGKS